VQPAAASPSASINDRAVQPTPSPAETHDRELARE